MVASAGGMFVSDRGVRAMGQGFAKVASVRDGTALWYNPAGLLRASPGLVADLTAPSFRYSFQRTGDTDYAAVKGAPPFLPLPQIAYVHDFGSPRFRLGIGMFTPNVVPSRWPETVTVGGATQPAPQRYSLLNVDGSLWAEWVLGGAYELLPGFVVGFAGHIHVGQIQGRAVATGCEGVVCVQPENPEFDAVAELRTRFVAPSWSVGLDYMPRDWLRIGASLSAPPNISRTSRVRTRLPSAALFRNAQVEGERIHASLAMPWIARGGVAVRPIPNLEWEVSLLWEGWQAQDRIRFRPEDIWIRGLLGVPDYELGPSSIDVGRRNVLSIRTGGEWTVSESLRLRAGGYRDNAAVPDRFLSVLNLDTEVWMLGVGAAIKLADRWWVDLAYGHLFMKNRTARNSEVGQLDLVRPPAAPGAGNFSPSIVGNGDYSLEADLFGVGIRYQAG